MITWVDVPGCQDSVVNGVAPDGTLVGVARESSGRVRGFIMSPTDELPRLVEVGDGDTFLQDVAAGGLVIGDYALAGRSACFVMRAGDVSAIAPPGARDAWAGGILSNGDCCGALADASGRRAGFRRLAGRFDEVLPAGADAAVLHGIGEGGEVVGACSLGGQLSGFLMKRDGRLEWLDPPRGEFVPSGCAAGGSWIVGSFHERGGLSVGGELREGRWRSVEIPEGPWLESAIVGCCEGVGLVGWVLGGDGRKRGFLLDDVG